jgi:hypothetical protein
MMMDSTPTLLPVLRTASRSALTALALMVFLAMPAHAQAASTDTQSTDIQMLPPMALGAATTGTYASYPCTTTKGNPLFLAWDGYNPINCVTGFTSDPRGNLATTQNFVVGGALSANSMTATTEVTIGGSVATSSTVNAANLISDLLAQCAAQGGGTVEVDAHGNFLCASNNGPPTIIK